MTLQRELQRERNKLLLLRSDAHIEHAQLTHDHLIGTQKDCDLCHLYNCIQQSDELIIKKLQLIKEDNQLIGEFKELSKRLGRVPLEIEFKKTTEAKVRFGSWANFVHETFK